MTLAETPTKDKSQFVYNAEYGGAEGLPALHGTLQMIDGRLVFISDAGEFLYPTADEWDRWGILHGEVSLELTARYLDACRARAERAMLERSNHVEVAV